MRDRGNLNRNSSSEPFPTNTEPERISVSREVEDHAVWRFQTNRPPSGKPTSGTSETWTYARFAVICAKFSREEAVGAEIFSDFRSEANPLYCAGSDLGGAVGGLGETSINYRLERFWDT